MLPPWFSLMKDELHVFIQPQGMVLKRFKGVRGFKLSQVDQQKVSLNRNLAKVELDVEGHHLFERLQAILKDKRWQATSATLVLSSYFVRYVVMPWNAEIKTNEEFQAYLNHQFVNVYGDTIRNWNKCHNKVDYGRRTLASAISSQFLQSAHGTFSAARIKLDAVQPHLMLVANQARDVIKEKKLVRSCWLAVIADGRLCLCWLVDGEWCFVKSVRVEEDAIAQIEMLIHREVLLNSAIAREVKRSDTLPMLLHWVGTPVSEDIKISGCRVIKLTSPIIFASKQTENRTAKLEAI